MTSASPGKDPLAPRGGDAPLAEGREVRRSSGASMPRLLGIAGLIALAGVGAIMMRVMTQRGIGLWEDSFDYITAARSLVEEGRLGRVDGLGAFRPLTHFPPAYPWLLALLETAGFDIYDAARWLNVVLFALLIFLSGISLWWATGSAVWGIGYSALVLSSQSFSGTMA